jgi:hypothetical protein
VLVLHSATVAITDVPTFDDASGTEDRREMLYSSEGACNGFVVEQVRVLSQVLAE